MFLLIAIHLTIILINNNYNIFNLIYCEKSYLNLLFRKPQWSIPRTRLLNHPNVREEVLVGEFEGVVGAAEHTCHTFDADALDGRSSIRHADAAHGAALNACSTA